MIKVQLFQTPQSLDFNTFAGSLHRFGQKSRVYQDAYPVFYSYQKGLENHPYVYKNSVFNILMMILPLDDPTLYGDSLIQFTMSIYFNNHEAKLNGEKEIIPITDENSQARMADDEASVPNHNENLSSRTTFFSPSANPNFRDRRIRIYWYNVRHSRRYMSSAVTTESSENSLQTAVLHLMRNINNWMSRTPIQLVATTLFHKMIWTDDGSSYRTSSGIPLNTILRDLIDTETDLHILINNNSSEPKKKQYKKSPYERDDDYKPSPREKRLYSRKPRDDRDRCSLSQFHGDYKTTKASYCASCEDDMKIELDKFTYFCERNRKLQLGHELPRVGTRPILFEYNLVKSPYKYYIWKNEAMTHMMKSLPDKMYGAPARKLIEYCFFIYLKAKLERNLRGQCELTHYATEEYEKFNKTLQNMLVKPGFRLKTQRPKQDEIIQELTKIVTTCDGVDASKIGEHVVKYAEAQGIRDNAAQVQNVLNAIDQILKTFESHITLNNVFYQLFANLPPHPKIDLPLRRFVDEGNIEFILVHEFLRGYRRFARVSVPFLEYIEPCQTIEHGSKDFGTVLWYDFCHKLPTELKMLRAKIVVIITPIPRTKDHRPIPVPIIGDKYGILGSDAFVDFLRYLISVMGIFQVIDKTDFDELFKIIYDSFNWVKKENLPLGPMFIDMGRVNFSRNVAIAKIKQRFGEALQNVRELTPVGENGFTLDDLIAEIHRLNLVRPFKRYGRIVYDRLEKEKAQKDLTMHDKYMALERFQMYSIVEQDPNLYMWLRGQRAYLRYPFYQMKIPELANLGSP